MARKKYRDIKAYLDDSTVESRRRINAVRKLVKELIPEVEETISYNIPAFKTKKIFMYVAAFKDHIGVYPPVRKNQSLLKALKPFSNEKGNLRFALDKPLPVALLKRIASALESQVM